MVFRCQNNAKSGIHSDAMSPDFADPILIIPSRTIKTIMKMLMRASSVAVGLTIYIPLSLHLTVRKSTFHAKIVDFSTLRNQ